MALLIPENLRTRRDVPPGVNLLSRVLEVTLDDSATVWYEPLFDRAEERPDVVVLVPDSGVLVIEVLEEKANAIAGVRGGRLVVVRRERERLVESPLRRAEQFASRLAGLIRDEGRLAPDQRLPVASAGVFAYLGREEALRKGIGEAVRPERCLFRDDLDAAVIGASRFRVAIDRLLESPLRDTLSADAERLHRAVIHPDTVIGSPRLPFPTATPAEEVKVLDRQQEGLAKNLGQGHRVVRGVAGSGKTLVLTYRARLLAENFPHHQVLVTCFNRSLQGALARQLELGNVTVATIDRLVDRARAAADLEPLDFKNSELSDRASLGLKGLDLNPAGLGRFDHVLIDEAQDFPTPALQFAVRLLREGSDSLLVMADAAQNVYRQRFRWKDAGINAVGRTQVLRNSYRNTREILEYAHTFLLRGGELRVDVDGAVDDENTVIPPNYINRSGPLPLWLYRDSPQSEVLAIAQHCRALLDSGVPPGEIAVLYGTRTAGGFSWVPAIQRTFAADALPLFWATDPDRPGDRCQIGADAKRIVLSTIFSAKGLEFRHVILCGYLDAQPSERSVINRRVVYVGMTRATHQLVLTASGQHQYIADLEM